MNERIFITGMGVITPYGVGFDPIFRGIEEKRFAYGALQGIDSSTLPIKAGGFIPEDWVNLTGLPHNKLRGMGKYVKLGVMTAKAALDNAGVNLKEVPQERIGAFISSGTHGHNAEGLFPAFDISRGPDDRLDLTALGHDGIDHVHPWWLLSTISNNLIFFVTHFLGIKGTNTNTCNSAVGGAYVLNRAMECLAGGELDVALVGGADCPINWQILSDFSLFNFLAEGPSEKVIPMQPYQNMAAGTILSDASVFLVCETETHSRKRNAKVLAEVVEVANFGTFRDLIQPAPDGRETAQVLSQLLKAVPLTETLQVNAAAVGIPAWDASEVAGLHQTLGGRQVAVGSAKPWVGHAFSASFLLETAISVVAMQQRRGLPLPIIPDNAGSGMFSWAPDGPLAHTWAINLGQCFGGNTGGVLLHGLPA